MRTKPNCNMQLLSHAKTVKFKCNFTTNKMQRCRLLCSFKKNGSCCNDEL